MEQNIMINIIAGFLAAAAGFGLYALSTYRSYIKKKRSIEDDLNESKLYDPSRAFGKIIVMIMIGSTPMIYILLISTMLFVYDCTSLPNSSTLVANLILIMGATAFVANVSRIYYGKSAAEGLAYQARLPDYIKSEKDYRKKEEMIEEFREKNNLRPEPNYFGKYIFFFALPETLNIYMYLTAVLVMIFTGLMEGAEGPVEDISQSVVDALSLYSMIFLLTTLPAIPLMKMSAGIRMSNETFPKKVMLAAYGVAPSIIGLTIMIYGIVMMLMR